MFLIHGVKSKSGHDRSQSFGSILDVSGQKFGFRQNFIMILHVFGGEAEKTRYFN